MSTHVFDLTLRVLLYEEENEWAAHALEMDLIGYGKDGKSALEDLTRMIFSQISFAAYKDDPELVSFPAPKEFFDRWEEAQKAKISKLISKSPSDKRFEARAIFLTLEPKKAEKAIELGHRGDGFILEPIHA